MVLGASSYTYAEATRDQQLSAWIGSHIHAADYFGEFLGYWYPTTRGRE